LFQIELPELGRNGVLIQVKACGLSVSRVEPTALSHILSKGSRNVSVGAGHDIAGVVVDAGEDVTTLSKGDHVVGKQELGTFCPLMFEVPMVTRVKMVVYCVVTPYSLVGIASSMKLNCPTYNVMSEC
jgi:hypothetical protein